MKITYHYVFMLIGISIVGMSLGAYFASREPTWFITTFLGSILSIHAGFNHFKGRLWPFD